MPVAATGQKDILDMINYIDTFVKQLDKVILWQIVNKKGQIN